MSSELWLQPEWASVWTCFTLSFSTSLSLRAGANVKCIFCLKKKKMLFVFILKALSRNTLGFTLSKVKCHATQRFWLEREDHADTFKHFKSSTLFAKVRLPTSGQLGCNICEVASYFSSVYLKQLRGFLRHYQQQHEGAPHFSDFDHSLQITTISLQASAYFRVRTGSNISISS